MSLGAGTADDRVTAVASSQAALEYHITGAVRDSRTRGSSVAASTTRCAVLHTASSMASARRVTVLLSPGGRQV